MLSFELHRNIEPSTWRALVTSVGGGPFHLPETWLPGNKPENLVYLIWQKDGRPIAVSVGVEHIAKRLGLFRRSKEIHLPTAPGLLEQSGIKRSDLYAAIHVFAINNGYSSIEVAARWGEPPELIQDLGAQSKEHLIEFCVDLRKSPDELISNMHKKHRKNIRFAQEQRLKTVIDNNLEAFLSLREMQMSSSERASERGNLYNIQDEKIFRETYELIYRNGPGRVLFAREGNETVAALAFLSFGKKGVTVRSGSTERGYETCAMYLLQYNLLSLLRDEGCEEINIGGVPADAANPGHPQHGLYDYKRYYGGTEWTRASLKICLGKG